MGDLVGITTKDPTFGMTVVWIDPNQRDQAQTMGYAVVDASTLMATYLSHVIQLYAHKLPAREEVQQMLDILGRNLQKRVAG